MAYTKFHTDWKNYPDTSTPITEAALDYIETGIQAAASVADSATASAASAQTTANAAIPKPGSPSTNNVLAWNGSTWVADTVKNANIDAAAAIAQSKIAFDAWQSYTPSWTTSGTAPSVGNGTLTGRYWQIGKLVHSEAVLNCGSGTTYGTGSFRVTLPVASSSSALSAFVGRGSFLDGGIAWYACVPVLLGPGSSTVELYVPLVNATYASLTAANSTTPITFGTGDGFQVVCDYEAA